MIRVDMGARDVSVVPRQTITVKAIGVPGPQGPPGKDAEKVFDIQGTLPDGDPPTEDGAETGDAWIDPTGGLWVWDGTQWTHTQIEPGMTQEEADARYVNVAGGDSMSGNLTVLGNISATELTASSRLNAESGSFMYGLSMNGSKITNLGTPTASGDAATKAYVDSNAGSGGGATSLDDLTDVDVAGATEGQHLALNSGMWVPVTPATGSGGGMAVVAGDGLASDTSTGSQVLSVRTGDGLHITQEGDVALGAGTVTGTVGQGGGYPGDWDEFLLVANGTTVTQEGAWDNRSTMNITGSGMAMTGAVDDPAFFPTVNTPAFPSAEVPNFGMYVAPTGGMIGVPIDGISVTVPAGAYTFPTMTWELATPLGGTGLALDDLTDVDTSNALDGKVLGYDSGVWVPVTVSGGGGGAGNDVIGNFTVRGPGSGTAGTTMADLARIIFHPSKPDGTTTPYPLWHMYGEGTDIIMGWNGNGTGENPGWQWRYKADGSVLMSNKIMIQNTLELQSGGDWTIHVFDPTPTGVDLNGSPIVTQADLAPLMARIAELEEIVAGLAGDR